MVEVKIENISKKFGDLQALHEVNLDIKDKEFFVLLGPSGCGKTTLLNIIGGLEKQDAGSIYLGDTCIDRLPPEKRDMAMVFQSYALYPHMNAEENITFSLRIKKTPKTEIQTRLKETSEMLGISKLVKRRPSQLSGGERQRVALGRAIIRKPRLFLMDEPLSNIDAKLRVGMRVELTRLQKKLQTTTIYVTHDQTEAMTMADRVAIMHSGKVMQVDKPLDVYQKPNNIFVAGFIGTPPMNFLDCNLEDRKDGGSLKTDAFSFDLPSDMYNLARKVTPSPLIMGIRAENISVSESKKNKDDIQTEVYAIEPLGSEIIYTLSFDNHLVKAKAPPNLLLDIESKVWISIDKTAIRLFDKETGKSIF